MFNPRVLRSRENEKRNRRHEKHKSIQMTLLQCTQMTLLQIIGKSGPGRYSLARECRRSRKQPNSYSAYILREKKRSSTGRTEKIWCRSVLLLRIASVNCQHRNPTQRKLIPKLPTEGGKAETIIESPRPRNHRTMQLSNFRQSWTKEEVGSHKNSQPGKIVLSIDFRIYDPFLPPNATITTSRARPPIVQCSPRLGSPNWK